MNISAALDAERHRQGISINELAKRSHQSFGRTYAILTGDTTNPSIGTIRAILRGLGKSLAWLERQLD